MRLVDARRVDTELQIKLQILPLQIVRNHVLALWNASKQNPIEKACNFPSQKSNQNRRQLMIDHDSDTKIGLVTGRVPVLVSCLIVRGRKAQSL